MVFLFMVLIFVLLIVFLELSRWLFDDKRNKKSSYSPELVPIIQNTDYKLQDVLKYDASGQHIQ